MYIYSLTSIIVVMRAGQVFSFSDDLCEMKFYLSKQMINIKRHIKYMPLGYYLRAV